MAKKKKQPKFCNKNSEIYWSLLIEEYNSCLSQYAYRDAMSITLFTAINGIIGFLFIYVIREIEGYEKSASGILQLGTIGIFGFFILFILMLDLHKVLSCKGALRSRIREIEKQFKKSFKKCKMLIIDEKITERDGKSFFEIIFGKPFSVSRIMYSFTSIVWIGWFGYFGFEFVKLLIWHYAK